MQAKIGRWGGSLALRMPSEIVASSGLSEGQSVDVSVQEGDVIVRKLEPELTLDDMFLGRTTSEWRALYSNHFDWGPDVGREIIDE